jgi:hypothetical protein
VPAKHTIATWQSLPRGSGAVNQLLLFDECGSPALGRGRSHAWFSTGCEPHCTVTGSSRTALEELRGELAAFLGFEVPRAPAVDWLDRSVEPGHTRTLLRYSSGEGDAVTAYLLVPEGDGPFPGVLVHHQHNREYHLGKSEPVGIAGDALQAFVRIAIALVQLASAPCRDPSKPPSAGRCRFGTSRCSRFVALPRPRPCRASAEPSRQRCARRAAR